MLFYESQDWCGFDEVCWEEKVVRGWIPGATDVVFQGGIPLFTRAVGRKTRFSM